MKKMYVLVCAGFQGLQYYNDKRAAEAAAHIRFVRYNQKWEVKEVWVKSN